MASLKSNWTCHQCDEENKKEDQECALCGEPKAGVMKASIPKIITIIQGLNLQSMLDSIATRQTFSNEVGLSETDPDVAGLTHPREDLNQMSVHDLAKAKQYKLDYFARSFMGYIMKKIEISEIKATHRGNMESLKALKSQMPGLLNRNELKMVQSMTEVTKNPDYIAADEEVKKSMLEDVKTLVESGEEYQNIKSLLQVKIPKLLILVEHSKKKYKDELKLQQDLKNGLVNEIKKHMKDANVPSYTKKDAETLFDEYIDIYENRQPNKEEILMWTDTLQSLIDLCEDLEEEENELLMSEIEKERRKFESEQAELAQKDILQEEKREIESKEEKKRRKKDKNKRKKQRQKKTRKKKEAERAAKQEPLPEPEQKKDSQVETAITLVKSFNLETILDKNKFKNLTDFKSIIFMLLDEERVGSLIGEQVAIVSAPIVAAEIEKRMGEDREYDQKFWQDFGFVIVDDGIPLPMYLLEFFLDFKGLISHKAYREYVTSKKNRPMLINIIKNFQALWKGAKINDEQAGMLLDKLAASMNPDSIVNKWYVELQSINQTLTLIGDRGVAKPKKKKKKKKKKKTKKKKISDKEEVVATTSSAPMVSVSTKVDSSSSKSDTVTVSEQKSSSKPVKLPPWFPSVKQRIRELHTYITDKRPIEPEIIEWFGGAKMEPSRARFQYHKAKKEAEIEVSQDYLAYALKYINMLQEKLNEKGYMLVVVGGYATKLYSIKAKASASRSKAKWFKKNYNTQDIDLKLCRVRRNDEVKTITQMREILDETIIENSEQWKGPLGLYDPTKILERDRHGTIETKETKGETAEKRENPNIPLKITAPIATSFKKGGSPIEPIVEITFSNSELPEDMEEIDRLPIPSAMILIEGLMSSSMNFIDRLEEGERNLYMGKLVSWYWQLRYLLRYVSEDEYQSISSSSGKESKESAGRKGGRRKTRKRRKKRKTTKRKKPRKKRTRRK